MNNTVFNRIVAGLVCAFLGDIPVAVLRLYIPHLDQFGTIAWIVISAGLFALYMRYGEKRKPETPSIE